MIWESKHDAANSLFSDGDQCPTQGLSWKDSMSSRNAISGRLTSQHFATSESIVLSSTEGHISNNQMTGKLFSGGAEIVQRVPQMVNPLYC